MTYEMASNGRQQHMVMEIPRERHWGREGSSLVSKTNDMAELIICHTRAK